MDNMNSFREAPVITYSKTPKEEKYALIAKELELAFPKDYLMPRGLSLIACPVCVEEGGRDESSSQEGDEGEGDPAMDDSVDIARSSDMSGCGGDVA